MIRSAKTLSLLLVVFVLTACAGGGGPPPVLVNPLAPQTDREKAVDVRLEQLGYINKKPAKRIGYTRFSGWNYIDDQHITVTFGANKNFLIQFKAQCYDAQHAQTLRFDTVMSSITPGDRAYLGRSVRSMQPCWIDNIYTLEKKPREDKEE